MILDIPIEILNVVFRIEKDDPLKPLMDVINSNNKIESNSQSVHRLDALSRSYSSIEYNREFTTLVVRDLWKGKYWTMKEKDLSLDDKFTGSIHQLEPIQRLDVTKSEGEVEELATPFLGWLAGESKIDRKNILRHVRLESLESKNEVIFLRTKISQKEDGIDFLINNAGAAWGEPFESFSEGGWDKVMDLNVKSLFFLTQKMKSLLTTNASLDDPSRVINIGSIDGLNVPALPTFSYSASKAAVHHLTRVMAAQLVSENILVNAIAPGPYPSNMLGAAVNHDYSEIEKRNPRKRVGTPEDIAGLAIFLCSRAGSYTVGETITSDGGIVKTASHNLS